MADDVQRALVQTVEALSHPALLLKGKTVVCGNEWANLVLGRVWVGHELDATLNEDAAAALSAQNNKCTIEYKCDGVGYCLTSLPIGDYKLIYGLPHQDIEPATVPTGLLASTGVHLEKMLQKQLDLLQKMKRAEKPSAELIDLAYHNALRLLRQVRHMGDYAQYRRGQKTLEEQDVDIIDLIGRLVERLHQKYGSHRLHYQFKGPPIIRMMLDPEKMEMLLLNLISNAFKFSEEQVALQLSAGAEKIFITVSNRGPEMMPLDDAPRPRVVPRVRNEKEMTGYGLSLVSQITNLHGGRLRVEREDDLTQVTVMLPWRKGSSLAFGQPDSPDQDIISQNRILIEMSDVDM